MIPYGSSRSGEACCEHLYWFGGVGSMGLVWLDRISVIFFRSRWLTVKTTSASAAVGQKRRKLRWPRRTALTFGKKDRTEKDRTR